MTQGTRFFVVTFVALLALPTTAATVYKCSWQGTVEYRDTPCVRGSQQVLLMQDETRSGLPGESLLKAGYIPKLEGEWCEFAIADTPDGQKDSSRKVSWAFGKDGFLDYQIQGSREQIRTPYKIVDQEIQTKSGLIGAWGMASYRGQEMVLSGPLGGYAFLKRGECSPTPEPEVASSAEE